MVRFNLRQHYVRLALTLMTLMTRSDKLGGTRATVLRMSLYKQMNVLLPEYPGKWKHPAQRGAAKRFNSPETHSGKSQRTFQSQRAAMTLHQKWGFFTRLLPVLSDCKTACWVRSFHWTWDSYISPVFKLHLRDFPLEGLSVALICVLLRFIVSGVSFFFSMRNCADITLPVGHKHQRHIYRYPQRYFPEVLKIPLSLKHDDPWSSRWLWAVKTQSRDLRGLHLWSCERLEVEPPWMDGCSVRFGSMLALEALLSCSYGSSWVVFWASRRCYIADGPVVSNHPETREALSYS